MISSPDGPFVNVSRLNFNKYAAQANVAKPLFEYLFYHENDVRNVRALTQESQILTNPLSCPALGSAIGRLGHSSVSVQGLVLESATWQVLLSVSTAQAQFLLGLLLRDHFQAWSLPRCRKAVQVCAKSTCDRRYSSILGQGL